MIGRIKGQVIELLAPTACIMTASGVGYDIELPVPDFCQLQLHHECIIFTHMHVREDAQLLYGFLQPAKRDVFRTLIRINGVGAKMALAIMSTFEPNELKRCVTQADDTALIKVPGVGKKTAQRLLIELKDKLEHVEEGEGGLFDADNQLADDKQPSDATIMAEVEAALISLGYRDKEAHSAIKAAKHSEPDISNTQTLLKLALKQLSGF